MSLQPSQPNRDHSDFLSGLARISNRFAPEQIGVKKETHPSLTQQWSQKTSREVYFGVTGSPTAQELSSRLERPEATVRAHLVALERVGLIIRNSNKHPRTYRVSIRPFIDALSENHPAVSAMRDHFLSADRLAVVDERSRSTPLHSTLLKVAQALQNVDRIKVFLYLKRVNEPLTNSEIKAALHFENPQATPRAISALVKSELIFPTGETKDRYTQRSYRPTTKPFATIINDFFDEFGNLEIFDFSDTQTIYNGLTLEAPGERAAYLYKTSRVFSAIRKQEDLAILRWFHRKSSGRMASDCAKAMPSTQQSTEFTRIRKLREVGLLRHRNTPNGVILRVNWSPLRSAFAGLLG